jgi:dipeptidyl aminopeptidase/acylaminoacyl peptidase
VGVWLVIALITASITIGHALPGGNQIIFTGADARVSRTRTFLLDVRATLRYALPARLGAITFIDWVTHSQFLLRQAVNRPRYLLFEVGTGAQALNLPDDCREGTLRGRGAFLSCAGRQGGGILVFSTQCALGNCLNEPHRWLPGALVSDHQWSPDGTRIVFSDIALRTSGLAVLDLQDAQVYRIADSLGGIPAQVSWSPGGERLAYYTAEPMSVSMRVFNIYRLSDDVSIPLSGAVPDAPPSWSPDGELLALFEYDVFGADVFVFDLNRRSVEWVTEGKGASAYPRWSPDGELLAFYVNRGGQVGLLIADLAGGSEHIAASLRGSNIVFAWRPCTSGC